MTQAGRSSTCSLCIAWVQLTLPCCTSVYIVPHVCICTPHAPDEDETTVVHLSNEDLVNDYKDYSGEPSQMTFISVMPLSMEISRRPDLLTAST